MNLIDAGPGQGPSLQGPAAVDRATGGEGGNRGWKALLSIGTLGLLAVGCSSRSADEGSEPPPREPPPSEPAARGPDAQAAPARFEGIAALLPHPEVDGWRVAAAGPRVFEAGTLYTYMDGQSDSYLEYGIQRMAVADYHPTSGAASKTVQIEIYDMGSADNAFGRFSRFAVEGGDPAEIGQRWVDVGSGGVASGTDLAFWRGPHMIKLTFLDESPDATEESLRSAARTILLPLARTLAGALPGEPGPLPAIAQLPAADRLTHSEIRFGRAALGLDELAGTIAAEYSIAGKRMRLYLLEADAARATAAFAKVTAPLTATATVAGLGEAATRGTDPDRGEILVIRNGGRLVIVTNSDTPGAAAGDLAGKTALARAAIDRSSAGSLR